MLHVVHKVSASFVSLQFGAGKVAHDGVFKRVFFAEKQAKQSAKSGSKPP